MDAVSPIKERESPQSQRMSGILERSAPTVRPAFFNTVKFKLSWKKVNKNLRLFKSITIWWFYYYIKLGTLCQTHIFIVAVKRQWEPELRQFE
jgi:hypothetical protein